MTTRARQAEADRVEALYLWSLNQLGNAMAIDAREVYAREVPLDPNPGSTGWLTRIIRLLFGFRREAHDLAVSYYRLSRALRTGYTVAVEGEEDGDTTTLERLREEFEEIVDFIDISTGEGDGAPRPRNLRIVDPDDDVTIESVADLDDLIEKANDEAREEALDQLDQLGTSNLLKDLARGRAEEDAWETARNRGAAAAARITMNAARGLTYDLADTDLRVKGWVRYSTTGTPCGWCAMLISRGVVYKTRASASASTNKDGNRIVGPDGQVSDQNKFHENCHCVAVPIYLDSQYAGDMFALNREYAALWPKVTKGYGGDEALRVWRRYFREQQKRIGSAEPLDPAPAQEAA